MGLYFSTYRFDGTPPDLDAVRTEAKRRLGTTRGIERITIDGATVFAYTDLDPFTNRVLSAIFQELGGQAISIHDGSPIAVDVPSWAHRPLRELGWSGRMRVRYQWWIGVLSTIKRRKTD